MKNLLIPVLLSITIAVFGQSDLEKVKSTIAKNTIEGHIYFLASDELKGRETGTPEIDIAAEYLATSLRRYGVKAVPGATDDYFQMVPFEKVTKASNMSLKINEMTSDDLVTITSNNINYTGDAVFVGYGLEDYGKDVSGKVLIALAGSPEENDIRSAYGKRNEKVALAMEKGAIGLIEIIKSDVQTWKFLKHRFNDDKLQLAGEQTEEKKAFSHIWLSSPGEQFQQAISTGKIEIDFNISGINKTKVFSKNVVGMVEGTDPKLKNEYVIYSAHYDHVGIGAPNAENDSIYNGARDNAVGVVTVMSAAENIAKYPTKRSALFILFTAEEKGLLGSSWYANNPLIPMEQMVYCFNSDNGGYNDKTVATIVGLERTTAAEDIKKAVSAFGLKAIDDPAPEQGLFDRSDNVHFAVKGVPAPTFSLGFTAFDEEIMKYYHQTADNPETLDYDYLEKFFGAYVLACRNIANNPKTPFWLEGDKYYEAGKKLYSKQ